MKYSVLLLLLFAITACTPDTPLSKQFYEANKVKVLIGSGDRPQVHYETNDVEKIKDFLKYIDENGNASADCNYEGSITLYFTEADTNRMRFSTAEGCHQITYTIDDQTYTKPLTRQGIAYLDSLTRIY